MAETRDPFGFDPNHVVDMRVEMASEREDLPADWPSEIVRRAAKLMQERAGAAAHGPWHVELLGDKGYPQRISNPQAIVIGQTYTSPTVRPVHADYIAALSPDVATAIAGAWLHQADDMADHLAHLHATKPLHGGEPGWFVADENERAHEDWTATLRAALAYLREDAPKAVA